MTEILTNRKGKLRLYDGTATPFYLEVSFDAGDTTFPTGRDRPEEIVKMDRGNMNANAHYVTGNEEYLMQPLEMSFSCLVTDLAAYTYLNEWIAILNGTGTAINAHTIVTTKGTTQNNGVNNNPAFGDTSKLACNIELLFDGNTADQGWKFAEVHIPYPKGSEGDEGATLAIAPKIFGTITPITAWTSGTNVTT